MSIPLQFSAFRIHADRMGVEHLGIDELNPGEITVQVAYSSVNYKDALAGTGQGKILRQFPLIGGIDLAGIVVTTDDLRFRVGDSVVVTGCGLSETRDGGYSQYQRVQASSAVALPSGLSLREAMLIGTAGFTAALSLWRMQQAGQRADQGPIVVTGASGGVGTLAIDIFTQAGFEVHAISGKSERFPLLHTLGAKRCIAREELQYAVRPLETAVWAGAVDNVGGAMLGHLTRVMQPWGNIASCGMAGGIALESTVMPFIIRGISLLGINSANTPMALRSELWLRLASDWKPAHLAEIETAEIGLDGLPDAFARVLSGASVGRTLVKL